MRKISLIIPLFGLFLLCSCADDEPEGSCTDGIQNSNEEGVDCGGRCDFPCECFNEVKDQDEICVDCGGPCAECEAPTGRYAENVFPSYQTISVSDFYGTGQTLVYGRNTFVSGLEKDLELILFEPEGDDATERPIILALGGTDFSVPPLSDDYINLSGYAQYFVGNGYLFALVYTRYHDITTDLNNEDMDNRIIEARSDILAAIRYFRKNADNHGVDDDNIWLMGYSGGGLISMMAAFLNEDDASDLNASMTAIIQNNGGFDGNSGNEGYPSHVKGVIDLAGFLFDIQYVDQADNVSFFGIIGSSDRAHPLGCEDNFYDERRACGPVAIQDFVLDGEVKIITEGDPWGPMDQDQCPECGDEISAFIARRLGYCQ